MDDRQPVLKPVVNTSSADFNHKMETRPIGGSVGAGWVGPVSSRSNVIRLSEPQIHAVSEPADSVSINIVPIPDVRLQSGAVVQKMKDLENNCTDRLEMHRASLPNTSSPAIAGQKPKKGSFQITSVINRKQLDNIDRTYEDADSIGDDYDETNTEDLSSEIMDTSKMTDIDQDPSSEDTVQSLVVEDHNATATRPAVTVPNSLSIARDKTRHESPPSATSGVSGVVTETENAGNSGHASKEDDASFGATRFRIVKVSNERYVRGRWSCYDYQDSERTNRDEIGSGNSSTASSVHYGGDDNTKNTFPATSGTTLYTNGTPVLISAEVMASAPNSDYTPIVIGTGVADTSGAPHMAPVVSQPISSNQPAPAYGTPTDYMAPMPPSSQSIPQPAQQTQPMTQNLNTAVSVAPSDSVDLVAKSALHHTGALGAEFPPTSGSPSAGISPNDNLQAPATEFRPVPTDNKQAPPVNDTDTADGTGVSEVGVAKALMTQAGLTQPLLEMVQTMHYPLGTNRDDDESGASTVAIDNKIEQAMDLVKSHLMFAVREEVLVLKEQIKELLEKNSQLEYENTVLRAGASPETLAKLSQANPTQTQTSTS